MAATAGSIMVRGTGILRLARTPGWFGFPVLGALCSANRAVQNNFIAGSVNGIHVFQSVPFPLKNQLTVKTFEFHEAKIENPEQMITLESPIFDNCIPSLKFYP